jgi:hypothetical protein
LNLTTARLKNSLRKWRKKPKHWTTYLFPLFKIVFDAALGRFDTLQKSFRQNEAHEEFISLEKELHHELR